MSEGYVWDSEEEFLAEMEREGCVKSFSWDEDGGLLISWHLDVLKEKYPDVHAVVEESLLEEVDESLRRLTDDGLLDMSFQEKEDGTIEAVYSLTEEGERIAESLGSFQPDYYPPENL